MDTCTAGDGRLEYQVRGNGEPLLTIHGAMVCDAFEPIADTVSSSYKLITYRRRGFGGSSAARTSGTISDQVADAVALLDHVGVQSAHVAGHSYGGAVALQMALEAPDRVHSLLLLEPPLLSAPSGADFGAGAAAVADIYQSGDREGALLAFLTAVGGEDPVPRVSKNLSPGWYEQAVTDVPTLFEADLSSIGTWQFTEDHAKSITQPALNVLGTKTFPLCAESHELLKAWLPNSEVFVLEDATHMLQWDDPEGMTKGMMAFLARHPMRP